MDLTAGTLGIDPVELRRRNLIRPDQQPCTRCAPLPITFDNGDYPASLAAATELAATWAAEDDGVVDATAAPGTGGGDGVEAGSVRRGIGCAIYVQMAGVGPSRGNRAIGLDIGGWSPRPCAWSPTAASGCSSVSPRTGRGTRRPSPSWSPISSVWPSTASRSSTPTPTSPPTRPTGPPRLRWIAVGGGAAVRAGELLAAKVRAVAADLLEAHPDDIVLADGRATVAGTQIGLDLEQVAERAWQGWDMPAGLDPGLVATATYDPEQFTFSFATHVCRAVVDTATGMVRVDRYAVVNDCGTMVNPTIVEGQVHGGVAQGLGAALLEASLVGDDGQPRSTTFLDYLLPVSSSMPDITVVHTETPSPYTPGGMKGMGEGGTNGSFPRAWSTRWPQRCPRSPIRSPGRRSPRRTCGSGGPTVHATM